MPGAGASAQACLTSALSRYIVMHRNPTHGDANQMSTIRGRERSDRGERRSHHRHLHREDLRASLRDVFGPLREGYAAVKRGKVRPLILAVLHSTPMHGYQIMRVLEARTGGRWRPSAGTIYPTLQQLEDEGLVHAEVVDGRKVYNLTDAGREAAEASPLTRHPWFAKEEGGPSIDLKRLAVQVIGAAIQVKRVGSAEAQSEAQRILVESRRRLYRLLADDESTDAPAGADLEEEMRSAGESGSDATEESNS